MTKIKREEIDTAMSQLDKTNWNVIEGILVRSQINQMLTGSDVLITNTHESLDPEFDEPGPLLKGVITDLQNRFSSVIEALPTYIRVISKFKGIDPKDPNQRVIIERYIQLLSRRWYKSNLIRLDEFNLSNKNLDECDL